MSTIKRRHFLQFAGATAVSLGLNPLRMMQKGDRYAQVLAAPTSRKLALLVGINDYDRAISTWSPLDGCVTDVRMQKELLVHRFGFHPNDIVILTDQEATRDGIITTFQEHLIAQAKPGDVVVFHYSGHGSRVVDPNPYRDDLPLNSTFVPIDSPLPENYKEVGGTVDDITGKTLFLLMSALDTELVTVVLDSCHSGGGKRGAVTYRSRDGANPASARLAPSDKELALQEQLQSNLDLSDDQVQELRQKVAKGVVIASAADNELAADAFFNGFYAGAFTYLLTQYLWQQIGDLPLERTFVDIDRTTQSLASSSTVQNPEFETNVPPELEDSSIYFCPKTTPPAEAIATEIEGDRVKLWLGGIHPDSLRAFGTGAVFTAVAPNGDPLGQVQLTEVPQGLEAEGQLVSSARATTSGGSLFLQEQLRTVPEDLTLKIGVDESLFNEREAIQQALGALARIQLQPSGSDDVDYFLGRIESSDTRLQFPPGDSPPSNSIALLSPGLAVIPDSWGEPNEAVIEAVDRLQAKLKTLLAIRVIRSIVNPGSSDLDVEATLNVIDSEASAAASIIQVRGATRSLDQDESSTPTPSLAGVPADASRLPIGAIVELQITNNETRPVNESDGLYIAAIATDSSGSMNIIFPTSWSEPDLAAFVESRQSVKIPDPERGDNFVLRVLPPVGVTEVLIIASAIPLRRTLTALGSIAELQEQANPGSTRGQPLNAPQGDEFVEVADELLNDLDSGTRGLGAEALEDVPANTRGVSTTQLTALSITFEVYDPDQV